MPYLFLVLITVLNKIETLNLMSGLIFRKFKKDQSKGENTWQTKVRYCTGVV